MDEVNTQAAVETTEAPVTESAPVEESTVDNSVDTSEKTETTQKEAQVSQTEDQVIPKSRLDEVIKERNELREFKAQQEALRQEQERLASMTPDERSQEEQLAKAKETIEKMFGGKIVTEADLQKQREAEKAKNMFISECNRLEGEYNGKNGMPKFVPQEVAEFMDQQAMAGNLITDPETAYKLKNLDAIAEAKAKAQKSTAYSESQSGGMNEVSDARQADLEAASQTGDFKSYLKKYAGISKN